MKLMDDGEVNYAACSALEGVSGNTAKIGDLREGSTLCLRTTAGRWAKLLVTAGRSGDGPSGNGVDLDVTVWDN